MSSDWTLLCKFCKEYSKLTIFRVQTSIFQSTGKDKMAPFGIMPLTNFVGDRDRRAAASTSGTGWKIVHYPSPDIAKNYFRQIKKFRLAGKKFSRQQPQSGWTLRPNFIKRVPDANPQKPTA
jgi:hypothetical protein